MLPGVLLLLIAVYMAAILWRGRTFRIGFAASRRRGRGAALYAWAMGVAISFGLPAAVGVMLLLGPPLAWNAVPAPLQPLVFQLEANGLLVTAEPLLIGIVGGTLANILVSLWRARRGRAQFRIGRFPDVTPTSRGDFLPAILLSISAGISEELFFRLFVPLLVALVSGNALLGCAVATLLFGALHRYQGAGGVIATTLVGAVLAYVYLASGALWLAMLFHIVIDLNALVVRSAIAGAWRVSSSSASRS